MFFILKRDFTAIRVKLVLNLCLHMFAINKFILLTLLEWAFIIVFFTIILKKVKLTLNFFSVIKSTSM